ncbi:glycosyl transferase, partial [Escherichia coli]|nr:glycosyl transferase [Escherichia coli]
LFCSRNKLVVINDADTLEFDSKTKKIQEEFAKIFPFKSTFEI